MKIYAYLLVTIASLLLINACSDTQKKQSLPTNNTELAEEELWVDMLVEIPAGSIKKFELNKQNGLIEMDSIDGKPRFIQYLGYPANYGMIPNTLLPLDKGGDGDPLDILSIGPVAQSGELI
ncbi:MAG: inorganic diphosphatase [Flavobacteriales bacterium]|nr:inorganic diphosphatase [Flavobacteriales bacterium]